MKTYPMDVGDLTANSNAVKDQLLMMLEKEGLLKKPAAEIAASYAIVVAETGWFGKLFHKAKAEDKPSLRIYIMKEV